MEEMVLTPIGHVRNSIKEKMKHGWGSVESELVIESGFLNLLDGLEGFSHIIVLFQMHQVSGEVPVKVHPQGREDLPLVGLFATRAPHRPNSVGVSVVKLLERNENGLGVKGLDAIDGTPILDIKPYLPKDVVPDAQCPEWVSRLDFT